MLLKRIMNSVVEVDLRRAKTPPRQSQRGDRVLGEMSDDLKRLFVVKEDTREKLAVGCAEMRRLEDSDELEEMSTDDLAALRQKHLVEHNESEFISNAFWSSLRHEFPEAAEDPNLAIDQHWQVVIADPQRGSERRRSYRIILTVG